MTDQLTQQKREALEALEQVLRVVRVKTGMSLAEFNVPVERARTYILNSTPEALRRPAELRNIESIDQTSDMTVTIRFASCRAAGAFAQWLQDHRQGVPDKYIGVPAEDDPDRRD